MPLKTLLDPADKPEGRSVTLRAYVTLSGLTSGGDRDLRVDIAAIDPSSKTRPVGDGPAPALPLGGRVLHVKTGKDGRTTLTIAAWNTGESGSISRTRANPSHAERQFIDYMERRQRTDQEFFKNIVGLDVHIDRSPCSPCSDALIGLLRAIRRAQPSSTEPPRVRRGSILLPAKPAAKSQLSATLRWTKRYDNRIQGTTWQSLRELRAIGWRLIAPAGACPLEFTNDTDLVDTD